MKSGFQNGRRLAGAAVVAGVLAAANCFAWPYSGESNPFDLTPTPASLANSYFSAESGVFSLTAGTSLPLVLSNVRASQRAGTAMVDILYDLAGPASQVYVSAATNSGGFFVVPPSSHFSGDGITNGVSGTGLHILWNAALDYPNQVLQQVRVQVAVRPDVAAVSPWFALDTRNTPTGSIEGVVRGNGFPLNGAQVRVEGSSFGTNTAGGGTFTLRGVPVGLGYVVTVAASNYVAARLTGVNVTAGGANLGTIDLVGAGGSYRLIGLLPEVNPEVTEVEEGGIGYRYYKVVKGDGSTGVGGIPVSLRRGTADIPQNDVSDIWAGAVAGVSDADGVVRVSVPAEYLTTAPDTIQVLQGGQLKGAFLAKRVPRKYDQVWKHKFNGGVSFKVGVVRPGVEGAYESEIKRRMSGGAVVSEEITRARSAEGRAGLEVGAGVHLGPVAVGAKVGAGGFVAGEAATTYDLPYGSTDPGINAMKLYVVAGDPLSMSAGPEKGLVDFVRIWYEGQFMRGNLKEASGGLTVGGSAEAGVSVGFGLGQAGEVKVGASGSAEVAAFAKNAIEYRDEGCPSPGQPVSQSVGLSASAEANLNLGFYNSNPTAGGLGFKFFAGSDRSYKSTVSKRSDLPYFHEVSVEQKCKLKYGISLKALPGFGSSYDPEVTPSAGFRREFTEKVTLNFTNAAGFGELAAREPFWGAVSGGSFGLMLPDLHARMMESLFDTSVSQGLLVHYDKSVYGAYELKVGGDLGLDVVVAGLNLKLEGELERGAKMKMEEGHYWQGRRLALASYPAISETNIPTQEIFWLEGEWACYASEPIRDAIHQATVVVWNAVNNVVQAGEGAIHATLSFGPDVMASGSQVVSSWAAGLAEGGGPQSPLPKGPAPEPPPAGVALPPLGASNYVYGIAGVFRFDSTNAFNGMGTLAIHYSDTNVSGLDETELRIYRLPEGTNRWQLVGGTVDAESNIVSVAITNLGTYAVAPPLPTGDLWLQPSTNALAADGVSELTVVVTNLVLNTGCSATQAWLFTASAVGANILSADADTNRAGVQIVSTNASLTLRVRAPEGGTYARVSVSSVAGDAYGQLGINLVDDVAPATPTDVSVSAGQSRIWVTWQTNSEPDLAGYRVYYRPGTAGPPWEYQQPAVEGVASPVQVSGTNIVLRGLTLGTNYFVAVSAVDTTGNESPLSGAVSVSTAPAAPAGPRGVAVRFGADGTNILMWGLSEDDGYNDRDVAHYDVFRAVLPGGSYEKVGEVSAGVGLYSGANLLVAATQYVGYAVSAVASNGVSSSVVPATRYMANGVDVDTDGDGIPDTWMIRYFGHPTGQAGDQSYAWSNPSGDGLSNLEKYLLGKNPLVWDNLHFTGCKRLVDGRVRLGVFGQVGHNYTLLASTNLVNWQPILVFGCTNDTMDVFDPDAGNYQARFYRLAPPGIIPELKLGIESARPLSTNGLSLVLFSLPGLEYRIDASTDLVNWTAVTNFVSTNATMHFMDASATNYSRRFYRAVAP